MGGEYTGDEETPSRQSIISTALQRSVPQGATRALAPLPPDWSAPSSREPRRKRGCTGAQVEAPRCGPALESGGALHLLLGARLACLATLLSPAGKVRENPIIQPATLRRPFPLSLLAEPGLPGNERYIISDPRRAIIYLTGYL